MQREDNAMQLPENSTQIAMGQSGELVTMETVLRRREKTGGKLLGGLHPCIKGEGKKGQAWLRKTRKKG